jgi:hypothetical protein
MRISFASLIRAFAEARSHPEGSRPVPFWVPWRRLPPVPHLPIPLSIAPPGSECAMAWSISNKRRRGVKVAGSKLKKSGSESGVA